MERNVFGSMYDPGQCNIGPAEIRKRLRIGYIGLSFMCIYIVLVEVLQLPVIWKLGLFVPAIYCFSGFLQGWQKFCFWFGLFGLFSITGKRMKVADHNNLRKDRSKAMWLIVQVFTLSLLVTLAYYFL